MQKLVKLTSLVVLDSSSLDLNCTYHPRKNTCDRSLSFPNEPEHEKKIDCIMIVSVSFIISN